MNFKIERKHSESKKKSTTQIILVCLAVFFLLLSIILIIIQSNSLKKNKVVTQPPSQITNNNTPSLEKEGLKVVDENSNERPIAVMIDNNIGEEAHAGLQESYINYEIIVEGGLTRIMAIYKDCDDSLIGPVRSARHYFIDYALESDAVYTHYGWSPYAERDINDLKIDYVNGINEQTPFRRDQKLKSPHNVFTTISYLKDYINEKGYSMTTNNWKLLNYSDSEININEIINNNNATAETEKELLEANKVTIDYSYYENRSYTYDSENKYYLRSSNGKAHLDRRSEKQLHYKNIIIEYVENKQIDEEDRQELTTVGEGTGYYITNGYAAKITWNKKSRTGKTTYKYINGTEIKVNDGNTFIQIVPINNKITIE